MNLSTGDKNKKVVSHFDIVKHCKWKAPKAPVEEGEPALLDSVLIKSKEQENLFTEWLGFEPKLKLLYRGTKNGFKAAKFHFLCDKKGPTLMLVKSNAGYVYGGYTSKDVRKPSNYDQIADPECFIFSINHQTKHEPVNNLDIIITHYERMFTIFGKGNVYKPGKNEGDIELCDECNNLKTNYNNFGNSFKTPEHMVPGSKDL